MTTLTPCCVRVVIVAPIRIFSDYADTVSLVIDYMDSGQWTHAEIVVDYADMIST